MAMHNPYDNVPVNLNGSNMEDYEETVRNFRFSIPEYFNFGFDVIDRWAEDRTKLALVWADRSGDARVVAANVDLVMAVMSAESPLFAAGLLDRILAAAEYDRLRAVVVLNKTDLQEGEADEDPEDLLADYRAAGYRCALASCWSGKGRSRRR